jgi:hypothetical protein
VKPTRIAKIAGVSFAGFVAAAFLADKINLGQSAAQISGFAGAFIGTMMARRRDSRQAAREERRQIESHTPSPTPESRQPVD